MRWPLNGQPGAWGRWRSSAAGFEPELAVMHGSGRPPPSLQRCAWRTPPVRVVVRGWRACWRRPALQSADTVLTAVVGIVGLRPTMAAIRAGKRIASGQQGDHWCAPGSW
ncbi:MAG: hypothetical protein ACLRWQ_13140 [Flavonifractor plautii]